MFVVKKRKNSVYTRNEFQRVLAREKSRTERYGRDSCFIVFEQDADRLSKRIIRRLINAVSRRVRLVDEIGWVNTKGIGVLLAGATADDGQKVASDIMSNITISKKSPLSIYTRSVTRTKSATGS